MAELDGAEMNSCALKPPGSLRRLTEISLAKVV